MAQKAGLFAKKDYFKEEKSDKEKPWTRLNTYYDEKTIDIQWLNVEKKRYRKELLK